MTKNEAIKVFQSYLKTGIVPSPGELMYASQIAIDAISYVMQPGSCGEDNTDYSKEHVGVKESPLKTFPRVNEFEQGASYRH